MKKLVIVHWIDAWANSVSYYDPSHKYKAIRMMDVGWLLEENEDGVLIASCDQEKGERFRGESFTPWEMVTKIEEICYG